MVKELVNGARVLASTQIKPPMYIGLNDILNRKIKKLGSTIIFRLL